MGLPAAIPGLAAQSRGIFTNTIELFHNDASADYFYERFQSTVERVTYNSQCIVYARGITNE